MSFGYIVYLLGRFLLGAGFVVFGLRNIKNIPNLTAAMEKKGILPQPRVWMMVGVGIQIIGGAMVALGILPWLGALALAAFVLLAAYLFHPFWEFPEDEQTPHVNATVMNLALAGAFLMVAASGIFF